MPRALRARHGDYTARASSAASPMYERGVIASKRAFGSSGSARPWMNSRRASSVMPLPRVKALSCSYGCGRP
ncbi:hypothetical protein G6F65_023278 [Rhizopus arrhizus]|nr:hypothetical protein G6F65_023278 [Rhizopus arrhizus]